jgi:hypothetical protein
MKVKILLASVLVLAALVIVIAQVASQFDGQLKGYEEVPVISTPGNGIFYARIANDTVNGATSLDAKIQYELNYSNLEGNVTQAHIHFGQPGVNGGISVWLCSNLPSPPTPAGVQPCPPPPAQIFGEARAADVVGPTPQGIAPGEFAELIRAMRDGQTYVNVHTDKFPAGEIRSQIGTQDDHNHSNGQ